MKKIRKNNYYKIILLMNILIKKRYKKIGIVGVRHCNNIGANLLKYAMSIKLSEYGFIPYIIGTHYKNKDISFLRNKTNCIIIKKNFSEIHKNDFDILMVNSDQTWRKFGDQYFYDHGFLRFARNWNISKFVYGASLGYSHWALSKNDEIIIKNLLKNFKGISVREKGSIELIQKHLGFKPILVLDPTLLIDKKYYLNLLKGYKGVKPTNNNYILSYLIMAEKNTRIFIKNASEELGCEIFSVYKSDNNSVIKFIYGIAHSKAVITNSYHGTIFSIIFNKPFISILFKGCPKERFISLGEIFNVKERIFEYNKKPNISLLTTPLNINSSYISLLKKQSLNYLKQNLKII